MARRGTSLLMVALVVALVVVGVSCRGIRDVPSRAEEPSFAAPLDSASATEFTDWAARQEYSRFVGDSQRLAMRAPGAPAGAAGLTYGPLAWIYPVRRLGAFADEDFARGRVIARIHAESEYRKLGLRPGENYLVVRRLAADRWQAMMRYPGSDSVTYLDVEYEAHTPDAEPPPETVRFLWSDQDEDVWGRCSSGCCRVIGFREGSG